MGILLSLLFSFLMQTVRVEKKMETARASVLERQNLQMRLQDIFISLSPQKNCGLYTQQFPKEEALSLVVTFDNGIDPNPYFSGPVLGRVYLDNKKNLCLAYWPIDPVKNRPWRKEILASEVLDYSFQFLGAPSEKEASHSPAIWHSDWSPSQKTIPSTIRLILKQKTGSLQFAFRLPNSHTIPTFKEKKS